MGCMVRTSALLVLGLAAVVAQAQVWGFVDERGVPHFSAERLDARYELFYAGPAPAAVAPGAATGAAAAPPALLAAFEVSTAYKAVRHHLREAARANGIEYELLKAVVATESGFDPHALSPKGAVGLMQLMPETAQRFGVRANARQSLAQRLTDPRTNLQAGARYLAWLMKKFGGQMDLVLAAYNAGEGAVLRHGRRVPPYRETLNYVRTVTELRRLLQPPRATRQPQASLTQPAQRTASL
ncbi:MAG: lytic transglycosylase domain-containing protein [Gammaproteobacteria bacterium]